MLDEVPNAILRAADARAQRLSWAAAEQAGWQLPGLRAWIRRNRSLWHRVLGQARSEIHDATCDEAVTMLRRQLRASEPETASNRSRPRGCTIARDDCRGFRRQAKLIVRVVATPVHPTNTPPKNAGSNANKEVCTLVVSPVKTFT